MTDVRDEIHIHVVQCKGLRASKGGQLLAVAKVEFNNVSLGESSKIEINSDTGFVPFHFECNLKVDVHDPFVLDEIAQGPVLVTFSEILPKDKKQKEEKTNILGQCCVDLLPLLNGETEFTVVEIIHPVSTAAIENHAEYVLPEVEIEVSTTHKTLLMRKEQLDSCNLLTVFVESMFSVPESWNQNGGQYLYSACMPLPVTKEKETTVLLPGGNYRNAGEKELCDLRKWAYVPNASGSCLFIRNTEITCCSSDGESGDLDSPDDAQFRLDAENQKPHITWNSQRRCFLNPDSLSAFQQNIASRRYWPLEVIRTPSAANAKSKHKDEEPTATFHGVVYVDLAPLLYPGMTKLRGAYLVHPYSDSEVMAKTERKGIVNEDLIKTILGIDRSASSLGGQTKPVKGKGEAKGKQSIGLINTAGLTEELADNTYQESTQYTEARSYIVLELKLEKPMVQKRQLKDISCRIAELIPPRPAFPKKEGGSKKVIEEFEMEIAKAADNLLEEYRDMFGCDLSGSADDANERRKSFLYELNTSGKYYAFKEKLKFYVIKIVREKYMYKTKFTSLKEQEEFVSELYVFLLDHMHEGLNKYLRTEEVIEVPPPVTSSKMLKHFAIEAEMMFRFVLAGGYYQERITRDSRDAECWFDYGVFCLLIDDIQRAEECFKEVIALCQNHMQGLILKGVIASLHEDYAVAEDLLDASTYLHPTDILPWTILGLYYSGVDNSIMAERAFKEAHAIYDIDKSNTPLSDAKVKRKKISNQTNDTTSGSTEMLETFEVSGDRENSEENQLSGEEEQLNAFQTEATCQQKEQSIFLLTAKFLLDCHALQFAERALAHELISKKNVANVTYYELLGQLHLQRKSYDEAFQSFEEALKLRHENPNVWAYKGHLHYIKQEYQLAKRCYDRSLAYTTGPSDIHAIFIRLGTIYLEQEKKYALAKKMFLRLCKTSPSCVTWLGIGISCYMMNELSEAEQALNEANILENRNADVWAYLTLVCLKQMRHVEAEQSYKYAIQLGLTNEELTERIRSTMSEVNFDVSVL